MIVTLRFEIVVIGTALNISEVPSLLHVPGATEEIRRLLKTFHFVVLFFDCFTRLKFLQ